MKDKDISEIKDLFNKSGFKIVNLGNNLNGIGYFAVSEIPKIVDIWEGVEFAESNWSGRIYRIESISNFKEENAGFKPSTEQAYVDQLKTKAFKFYGEIKVGSTFMDKYGFVRSCNKYLNNWDYSKDEDKLFAFGVRIYEKGKWANKLPSKRAEVEVHNEVLSRIDENSHNYTVSFRIENMQEISFSHLHDSTNQIKKLLQNHINTK
jgi:hypothetical protein